MVKNKQYEEMYKEYKNGLSLAEVGKIFGITRQSVFSGFKCRNYVLRNKKFLKFQIFNGKKYTKNKQGYYRKTNGNRQLMHIDVWEFYNGKIPIAHDIHHINHIKSDNRIENLELYTKSEHARKFATGRNQYSK